MTNTSRRVTQPIEPRSAGEVTAIHPCSSIKLMFVQGGLPFFHLQILFQLKILRASVAVLFWKSHCKNTPHFSFCPRPAQFSLGVSKRLCLQCKSCGLRICLTGKHYCSLFIHHWQFYSYSRFMVAGPTLKTVVKKGQELEIFSLYRPAMWWNVSSLV